MNVFLDMAQMGSVFRIRYGERVGSCLHAHIRGKSFLITAHHLVSGIKPGDRIALDHKSEWLFFEVLGFTADDLGHDIAALLVDLPRQYGLPEEQLGAPLTIGVNVAFLGFPLNLRTMDSELDMGFPTPFLKSGVFSGVNVIGEHTELLFDAVNNRGFSGGPVFANTREGRPKVVAIISGYKYDDPITINRKMPSGELVPMEDFQILPNSGFMIGHHVSLGIKAAKFILENTHES